jgi:hypothetical protein
MKPLARFAAMLTGLVLLLNITPSWGQPTCHSPGCNPTASDANDNTAGGSDAFGFSIGSSNTAFGLATLGLNSGGNFNTAIGARALVANIGNSNTAIGYKALSTGFGLQTNNAGDFNTASGFQALSSNTTGFNNTASGALTLFLNSTGSHNAAHGYHALNNNTTGINNTASGALALFLNTTGSYNAAHGLQALYNNTDGINNTASGVNALFWNTSGFNNTASGVQALFNNIDGIWNTANGVLALLNNVSGSNNTAVGGKALRKALGTKNIGIGYQAGVTLTNGNNNIFIGSQGAGDESQTIRMGTAQTRTFIAGINVAGVSGTAVVVDANGQLGITLSSARYKQDIAPMGTQSEKLLRLQPVTFAYKDDSKGTTHYGLIAEEVAAVYPELVTQTATGEVQAVRYQELIPMLLNELQRQRQELAEVATLRKELAELRALVSSRPGH